MRIRHPISSPFTPLRNDKQQLSLALACIFCVHTYVSSHRRVDSGVWKCRHCLCSRSEAACSALRRRRPSLVAPALIVCGSTVSRLISVQCKFGPCKKRPLQSHRLRMATWRPRIDCCRFGGRRLGWLPTTTVLVSRLCSHVCEWCATTESGPAYPTRATL